MARLVVLTEGFTGRTYELKVDKTTVGRVEDNAFQVAEPSVSSYHCEILLRGDQVIVKDLDSTNGTFVNGNKVSGENPLKSGEILRLGQLEMRLETGDAKEADKKQSRTMVVTAGVKFNDLDTSSRAAVGTNPAFAKKSNKMTTIIVTVSIVLGTIILVLLGWGLLQTQ